MGTERQIKANRENSQKSTGPKNTRSTRWNATRHGLFAQGLTELDNHENYQQVCGDLRKQFKPAGVLENTLVEHAALDFVRWKRSQVREAEFITCHLHPAKYDENSTLDVDRLFGRKLLDPGFVPTLGVGAELLLYQRYESYFSNRFFRTLHEIEWLGRMRKGEHLPAPIRLDISVLPHDSSPSVTTTPPSTEVPPRSAAPDLSSLGQPDRVSEINLQPATAEHVKGKNNADGPAEPESEENGGSESSTAKTSATGGHSDQARTPKSQHKAQANLSGNAQDETKPICRSQSSPVAKAGGQGGYDT